VGTHQTLQSVPLQIERVPPHDVEAEMAVLGAILLDKDVLLEQVDKIRPESFYVNAHRLIFQAMVELSEEGLPIDRLVLRDRLARNGNLEQAGGAEYINQLAAAVPSSANADYYCGIIRDKGMRRNLIKTCAHVQQSAYEEDQRVEDLLDQTEQSIFKVTQQHIHGGSAHISDIVKLALAQIEEKSLNGVLSGFFDLDELTGGFRPSDLIIIAGRPSMGKSSFALNIMAHASLQKNVPVLFYSLEVTREQVAMNLLCSHARLNVRRIRTNMLTDSEWQRLTMSAGRLSEGPIFIDDTPGISLLELRAKARRLHAKNKLGMIMIDYLQLMNPPHAENRQQEVSTISRGLKALARELNVPVVTLCQLNRSAESREGHRPRMSDLRESGAIEQDADVVILLHRDDYYDNEKNQGEAKAIVAKQRHGPTNDVNLTFVKSYMRFESAAKQKE